MIDSPSYSLLSDILDELENLPLQVIRRNRRHWYFRIKRAAQERYGPRWSPFEKGTCWDQVQIALDLLEEARP